MNQTFTAIHSKLSTFWGQMHWNFEKKDTLLAVSSGKDSMLLARLFLDLNFPFAVAHANFQLRKEDSVADEAFVKKWCSENQVPFFVERFNLAEENSNIQVAARTVRYSWFEKLMSENKFNYLAVAHHLQDSIETFLINFGRGTGIKGLLGIPQQRDQIIRPLSILLPDEIAYLIQHYDLIWREDSSNAQTKYLRNKIRHQVLPTYEKSISNFYPNTQKTISQLNQDYFLLEELINSYKEKIVKQESGLIKIDLSKIEAHPHRRNLLFHLIKGREFNGSQVNQIWDSYHRQDGAKFISASSFAALRNKILVIDENQLGEDFFIQIEKGQKNIHLPYGNLSFDLVEKPDTFPNSKASAFLDATKISWPLTVRTWKSGDTFQPLGMQGKHQKLQDFFSNNKYSIVEKKRSLILLTDNKIAWVINERISQAFAVESNTKKCLHIKWKAI